MSHSSFYLISLLHLTVNRSFLPQTWDFPAILWFLSDYFPSFFAGLPSYERPLNTGIPQGSSGALLSAQLPSVGWQILTLSTRAVSWVSDLHIQLLWIAAVYDIIMHSAEHFKCIVSPNEVGTVIIFIYKWIWPRIKRCAQCPTAHKWSQDSGQACLTPKVMLSTAILLTHRHLKCNMHKPGLIILSSLHLGCFFSFLLCQSAIQLPLRSQTWRHPWPLLLTPHTLLIISHVDPTSPFSQFYPLVS